MTILEAEQIRMPFGTYGRQGLTLGEIAAEDPLYLDWLAGRSLDDTYLRDAVALLVDKHARRIDQAMARGEKPRLFAAEQDAGGRRREIQGRLF